MKALLLVVAATLPILAQAPPPRDSAAAAAAIRGLARHSVAAVPSSTSEKKPPPFRMTHAAEQAPPSPSPDRPPEITHGMAAQASPFALPSLVFTAFWYWCWLSIARLAIIIPLRRLGLYSPDHAWLLWAVLWPWRPFYALLYGLFRWLRERRHGALATAKWTPVLEAMALLYKPGAVLFGRLRVFGIGLFQGVGWSIERHVVLLGATAAGKTRWLLTLLGLVRSNNVFVIDAAAQMVNGVGRRLGAGGRGIIGLKRDVRVLDPHGMARGFKTSCWNVFREIDRFIKEHGGDEDKAVGFIQKIAEGLIRPEGNPANAWVTSEATGFFAGVIGYMRRKYEHQPEKLNLVEARRLTACGVEAPPPAPEPEPETPKRGRPRKKPPEEKPDGFRLLLAEMKAMGGWIAAAAGVMEASLRSDGGSAPRSALLDQTKWLDLPEMQAIVGGGSDFDLHDLKLGKVCLFVCAPVTDISGTLSGFFRLVSILTLEIFRRLETTSDNLKNPLLMVLDEMPSLGHIDALETAAPEIRKHGVRVICVAQDLEGLQRVYPKSWGGFLGNAEAIVVMTLGHKPTIDYVAQMLGMATRNETAGGGFLASLFSRIRARGVKVERPLVYNTQLADFLHPDAGNVLILRYGRPLKLKNAIFYTELPVWCYDPDPRYRERPGRRIGRAICRRLIAGPELPASSVKGQ